VGRGKLRSKYDKKNKSLRNPSTDDLFEINNRWGGLRARAVEFHE